MSRKSAQAAEYARQRLAYLYTADAPKRCETNQVYSDGSCINCFAVMGEACKFAYVERIRA